MDKFNSDNESLDLNTYLDERKLLIKIAQHFIYQPLTTILI